jgi:hypothetical protein
MSLEQLMEAISSCVRQELQTSKPGQAGQPQKIRTKSYTLLIIYASTWLNQQWMYVGSQPLE